MKISENFKINITYSQPLVGDRLYLKNMFTVFLAENNLVPDETKPVISIPIESIDYSESGTTYKTVLNFSTTILGALRDTLEIGSSSVYLNYVANKSYPESCLRTAGGYLENFGVAWELGDICDLESDELIALNARYKDKVTEEYSWGKANEDN